MASLFLTLAVITTGLYAGFMLTFLVAIMPGLAALPDEGFTAGMRRFNEKVPGPAFLVLFLGVIAFPAVAAFTEYGEDGWPLVAAALACAVVSHLVTIMRQHPAEPGAGKLRGRGRQRCPYRVRSPLERPPPLPYRALAGRVRPAGGC